MIILPPGGAEGSLESSAWSMLPGGLRSLFAGRVHFLLKLLCDDNYN